MVEPIDNHCGCAKVDGYISHQRNLKSIMYFPHWLPMRFPMNYFGLAILALFADPDEESTKEMRPP
uniref:Uncharacterized protein n=1 Tax=Oryza sativa subsp. japonica TaxID=39947 RepID=Q8H2Q8_ORYSJ|nr:hypothetical protein [Oryza sativa Japonica Group]BAD31497.1 hypothetical protein [Oryza sativa Japonica Group]